MLPLSVLDQSPVSDGETPALALQHTLDLAQLADRLGYARYWLAEHHNAPGLAGVAPEVLLARVASVTRGIRVGAGGIMLSHYSPLKVAECFHLLEALFPGRIDLGIGRAPGSNDLTADALGYGAPSGATHYPTKLLDLAAFLYDTLWAGHAYAGVHALPAVPAVPGVWLLGSSTESAAFAAKFGFAFCYAHFLQPQGGARVIDAYRSHFEPNLHLPGPLVSLAVRVVCADTDAVATRLATSFAFVRLAQEYGTRGPTISPEDVRRRLEQVGPEANQRFEQIMAHTVTGTPEHVRVVLAALAQAHQADEVLALTICHDPTARARSYALLAQAWDLEPQVEP